MIDVLAPMFHSIYLFIELAQDLDEEMTKKFLGFIF
jgi:hypothetical protein